MRYRKLDANNDMVWGDNLNSFWVDVPDAPAQAVVTRLQMLQGEWFLDRTAGTPWATQVLGFYTGSTRDPVINSRIGTTKGVESVYEYSSNLDRDTRQYSVQARIKTIYGDVTLAAILNGAI